jgi:hypothetical protein
MTTAQSDQYEYVILLQDYYIYRKHFMFAHRGVFSSAIYFYVLVLTACLRKLGRVGRGGRGGRSAKPAGEFGSDGRGR